MASRTAPAGVASTQWPSASPAPPRLTTGGPPVHSQPLRLRLREADARVGFALAHLAGPAQPYDMERGVNADLTPSDTRAPRPAYRLLRLLPLILFTTATCVGHRPLEGPDGTAFVHRFAGSWVLDAAASDAAPRVLGGIVVTGQAANTANDCRFSVVGGDLDYRLCVGPREERAPIPEPTPVTDSLRSRLLADLASNRPPRLAIAPAHRFLHISGVPTPLPFDGATRQLHHAPSDPAVTARLSRDASALIVELAIADAGTIADRYEIASHGTLAIARTITQPGGVELRARFLYRRSGVPPP